MFSDDLVRPGKERSCDRHVVQRTAAERFFSNDEIRRALANQEIQLTCQHLGVGGGRGSYQGYMRGHKAQAARGPSGQPLQIIFHEVLDEQSYQRMQGDLAAGALSELLGLRNGAPIAAAVDQIVFRDPFCGDTKSMSGWAQVVAGDELHRSLRMLAFRELGSPRSASVSKLLRQRPSLLSAILEAVFFRLVVLGDPDLSGNNFASEEDGSVRNINVKIGSSFAADRRVRFTPHPYFGNVMLRILELASGSPLPADLRRRYTDFLFTYGSVRARANLARFLEISPTAVDAMMERIGSIVMCGNGCFPELPPGYVGADHRQRGEQVPVHPDAATPTGFITRVKGFFGI